MIDSPYILYEGKVYRVHDRWDSVTIDTDLGFGIFMRITFTVVGVPYDKVSDELKSAAMHCMVVLLGGKRVIVKTNRPPRQHSSITRASIFLDEYVNEPPEGVMGVPTEGSQPRLEVGEYMQWLAQYDYDVRKVRATLNGRKR